MGSRSRPQRRVGVIVDVLLIVALVAINVMAIAITLRARRDHVNTASDPDQP